MRSPAISALPQVLSLHSKMDRHVAIAEAAERARADDFATLQVSREGGGVCRRPSTTRSPTRPFHTALSAASSMRVQAQIASEFKTAAEAAAEATAAVGGSLIDLPPSPSTSHCSATDLPLISLDLQLISLDLPLISLNLPLLSPDFPLISPDLPLISLDLPLISGGRQPDRARAPRVALALLIPALAHAVAAARRPRQQVRHLP